MGGPEKKALKEQIKIIPEDEAKKVENLVALERVLKDLKVEKNNEISKKITEGKRDIAISYHGSPFLVELDEFYQIVFLKDQSNGAHIAFEDHLEPEKLPKVLANAYEIPGIVLEKMGIKFPPDTVFTAEGSSRFSFQLKNSDKTVNTYMVVSDKHGIAGRVYQYQETLFDEESGQFKRNYRTLDKDYRLEETVTDPENFQFAFYSLGKTEKSALKLPDQRPTSPHVDSGNPISIPPKRETLVPTEAPVLESSFALEFGIGSLLKPDEKVAVKADQKPDEIRTFKNGEVVSSTTIMNDSVYIAVTDQTLSYSAPRTVTYEYLEDGKFIEHVSVKFPPDILNNKHISVSDRVDILRKSDGKALEQKSYDKHGNLFKTVTYSYDKDDTTAITLIGKNEPFISIKASKIAQSEKEKTRVYFHDKQGGTLSDYISEKEKNPTLTADQYISKLALLLDTPEKWQYFIDDFFQYETDTPDFKDPMRIGKKESMKEYLSNPKLWGREREKDPMDYYQTPSETVGRVDPETGKIQGDCEDIALLAQAILAKQNIKSEVVFVTNHAVCVYIMKRTDGLYDAYKIDTAGFMKNGKRFYEKEDEKSKAGFKTAEEAMSSIYDFYDVHDPEIRRKDNLVLGLATDIDQEQRMKNHTFYLRSIQSFLNTQPKS